ncbi:MAG: chemotaxis protein CheW [Bacteroidales bacterium]|jgi:purine-binding chemotaxis protein CheW|nr:chemotaxis protein CheW [Bacteroidales bacterium]
MKKLNSYLTFKLGDETFAANVAHVIHIIGVPDITKMPNSPDYLMGVMNLRGQVIPVIDPHPRFNIESQETTKESCIVVLEINHDKEDFHIGCLVDSVHQVLEISEELILPPPELGVQFSSKYIEGVLQKSDKFILILNINQVFSELNISLEN